MNKIEIEVLIREIKNMYMDTLEGVSKRNFNLDKYKERFNEIESTVLELDMYKKMWYEVRDKFVYIEQMNFPIHRYTYENIMSVMNEIKQKYFPETVKKYITIEVESEKESEVDAGMRDIKELVDNMGCPKMKISNSWVEVDKK